MKTQNQCAQRIIENIAWESREHAVIQNSTSWENLQASCDANEYVLDAAEVVDTPDLSDHEFWNGVISIVDRWLNERAS